MNCGARFFQATRIDLSFQRLPNFVFVNTHGSLMNCLIEPSIE